MSLPIEPFHYLLRPNVWISLLTTHILYIFISSYSHSFVLATFYNIVRRFSNICKIIIIITMKFNNMLSCLNFRLFIVHILKYSWLYLVVLYSINFLNLCTNSSTFLALWSTQLILYECCLFIVLILMPWIYVSCLMALVKSRIMLNISGRNATFV